MRIAVLTDIHANREAFEAVLADVAAHGVDQIALLGDIVG
jgi:predicted phosphodiesterase